MRAKTDEAPGIKSKIDDVVAAVAAVKRNLIGELPKMRRAGRTDVSDLTVSGYHELRRQRGRDHARLLVPRPPGDAHHRLRERRLRARLRGQLTTKSSANRVPAARSMTKLSARSATATMPQ
jgi:hypothetical protein